MRLSSIVYQLVIELAMEVRAIRLSFGLFKVHVAVHMAAHGESGTSIMQTDCVREQSLCISDSVQGAMMRNFVVSELYQSCAALEH